MTNRTDVFSHRTLCLITGASRGYGQAIAIRFAELLPAKSCILLIARSEQGLKKTAAEIERMNLNVEVKTQAIDLSKSYKKDYEELLSNLFRQNGTKPEDFSQSIVIHNAGSLGDVSMTMAEQTTEDALDSYWRFNLTSFTVLNAVWHQFLKDAKFKQQLVIGITSICALQPFKSWGIYCAGKAARDMLLHTYAEEEPNIIVLNYAPGPIDTDMQYEARTYTADKDLKDMFADMKSGGKLLTCDQSVEKFMQLLRKNNFDSGAHIDYYDVE